METMLSIKINKTLKIKAQEVAQALGVSLNAILNKYLKDLVDTRTVTFTDHPMPNAKTLKILKEISDDIEAGRNLAGPFDTAEEMIASLNS